MIFIIAILALLLAVERYRYSYLKKSFDKAMSSADKTLKEAEYKLRGYNTEYLELSLKHDNVKTAYEVYKHENLALSRFYHKFKDSVFYDKDNNTITTSESLSRIGSFHE